MEHKTYPEEEPYKELKKAFSVSDTSSSKKCIIITGAGVSAQLAEDDYTRTFGSWAGLLEEGIEQLKAFCGSTGFKGERAVRASLDAGEYAKAAEKLEAALLEPFAGTNTLTTRGLTETIFQKAKARQNSELARVFKQQYVGKFAFFTLNYDNLLEQALDLRSLDYQSVKYEDLCRQDFIEESDISAYLGASDGRGPSYRHFVSHLHGIYHQKDNYIFSTEDYKASMLRFLRFLWPHAKAEGKSLVFIGCSGTFEDQHFKKLFKQMAKSSSSADVFVLVRGGEAAAVKERMEDQGLADRFHIVPYSFDEGDAAAQYQCLAPFLGSFFPPEKEAEREADH